MEFLILILAAAIALVAGGAGGYQLRKLLAIKKKDNIEAKVEILMSDAKAKQKQILLDANDKALKIIDESKREDRQAKEELSRQKQRLEQRETLFDQKLLDLESKKQELSDKAGKLDELK